MEKYQAALSKYTNLITRAMGSHAIFVFILLFSALAGYLIVQSASIINKQPTDIQVDEARAEIQNIKIDEKSLRVVNELNSRNISLESLFVNRDNPFENQ